MKRTLAALAGLFLGAGAATADPAAGLWQTQPGDTGGYLHVQVSPCGNAVCGVIRKAFKPDGSVSADYAHLNKRLLWDMKAKGDGSYAGGKIWAPDRNKTYTSKMTLSGNTLKVSGCVAVICRSQSWTRIK